MREPTPPPQPRSPSPNRNTVDDGVYRPYKDDPVAYNEDEPTHDEIMLEQRQMMDGQLFLIDILLLINY